MIENVLKTGRRTFLVRACAGAAALGAKPAETAYSPQTLPTIRLGSREITRLISGGNPIGGWAHSTQNMSRHMLEYFTMERTVDYLEQITRAGINTWQCDHIPKVIGALRTARERGIRLNFICLHAERPNEAPLKTVMTDLSPIAIVHHGGVTDRLFAEGKKQQVRDFVKKVHDQGVPAGVSSHCPTNIQRIADEGWENDLFMSCLYYVNRPRQEQEALLGKVTVGEPFFESDPIEMTRVIRQIDKPCLGFKILAAGRLCANQQTVEKAFKFAFENIKPIDAVIVGMYPRFEDEIGFNVAYTRKYGATT
ncbi:MAG: hypothetical protein HXY20_05595 [Acidobacteria bacterium]|nr:hypothetical protein [Acidobacteriota bacterium]